MKPWRSASKIEVMASASSALALKMKKAKNNGGVAAWRAA
jgi:hypothetical protein